MTPTCIVNGVKPSSTYKTSNVAIGCLKAMHRPNGGEGKKAKKKREEKEQEEREEGKRQALV